MMYRVLFAIVVLISFVGNSQTEYPQDYFDAPLDIPLVLSGTFGELRSSHFHSGLDIKTQRKQGLKVYATASGYVSRIKVSHYGYGKALYITHPNGYTTVYGHLQKFSPKIDAYIKQCQYKKESYEVEMFPNSEELKVSKKEIVAFSGNSGGSGGPHLHYEIRDNQERPINPMLFGTDIKDSKRPNIIAVYAYPISEGSLVNGKNKRVQLRLIPQKTGDYNVEKISASGTIGFGVVAYDKQDLAPNSNGLSNIQTFFNGSKALEVDFKRISFDESKHIKRYIDYGYFKQRKSRIQKLFIQKNNPLSIFKHNTDNGYVTVKDSTASVYKMRVRDFKNNETWVSVPITGKQEKLVDNYDITEEYKTLIHSDETTELSDGKFKVTFYKNTVYEDVYVDYKVDSDILYLDKDVIPLQKNFYINYDISTYKPEDKDKLFIAHLYGYKKTPYYVSTKRKENTLTAKSKTLGMFGVAMDSVSPTIEPLNVQDKKWMSKYNYLKIKIEDKDSGISKYRATINDKWILMEYDYKTKTLTHDFSDNIVTDTTNNLRVIVTDNVGNSSTFETTFFRK